MENQEAKKLFLDNMKLVNYTLHRWFTKYAFDEDYLQTGYVGLWKACLHFSGDTQFSTFAVSCIKREILSAYRSRYGLKRSIPANLTTSLDNTVSIDGREVKLEEMLSTKDSNSVFLDLSVLTDTEKRVFDLCCYGFKQREIAEILGVTQSWVSRLVINIKNKLDVVINQL